MTEEEGDKFLKEYLNSRIAGMEKAKGKAREVDSSTPSASRRLDTSSGSPMKIDARPVAEESGENDTIAYYNHTDPLPPAHEGSGYARLLLEHDSPHGSNAASVNSSLDIIDLESLNNSEAASSAASIPEAESAAVRDSHHHVLKSLLEDVSFKAHMLGSEWRDETFTSDIIGPEFDKIKQELRRLQWILKYQEEERIEDIKKAIASDEKRDRMWRKIVADTQEQGKEMFAERERLWQKEVQRLQDEIMRLREIELASNASPAPPTTASRMRIRRRAVQGPHTDEGSASADYAPYHGTYRSPHHTTYHQGASQGHIAPGSRPSRWDTQIVAPTPLRPPSSPPLLHKHPSPKRLKLANELDKLRLQQQASGVDDDMTPEQIEAMFAEQEQEQRSKSKSASPSTSTGAQGGTNTATYTYANDHVTAEDIEAQRARLKAEGIRRWSAQSQQSTGSSMTAVADGDADILSGPDNVSAHHPAFMDSNGNNRTSIVDGRGRELNTGTSSYSSAHGPKSGEDHWFEQLHQAAQSSAHGQGQGEPLTHVRTLPADNCNTATTSSSHADSHGNQNRNRNTTVKKNDGGTIGIEIGANDGGGVQIGEDRGDGMSESLSDGAAKNRARERRDGCGDRDGDGGGDGEDA